MLKKKLWKEKRTLDDEELNSFENPNFIYAVENDKDAAAGNRDKGTNQIYQIKSNKLTLPYNGPDQDSAATEPKHRNNPNYGTYVHYQNHSAARQNLSDNEEEDGATDDPDCQILIANQQSKKQQLRFLRDQSTFDSCPSPVSMQPVSNPTSPYPAEFDNDESVSNGGVCGQLCRTLGDRLAPLDFRRYPCYIRKQYKYRQFSQFLHRNAVYFGYLKITLLFAYCLACIITFSMYGDRKDDDWRQTFIVNNTHFSIDQPSASSAVSRRLAAHKFGSREEGGKHFSPSRYFRLLLNGPFIDKNDVSKTDLNSGVFIDINVSDKSDAESGKSLGSWSLLLEISEHGDDNIYDESFKLSKEFTLTEKYSVDQLVFTINTNAKKTIPFVFNVLELSEQFKNRIVFSSLLLVFVYALIIFELTHRTLAAALGALGGISLLTTVEMERPSLNEIVTWVEWETILLMFGMMIIVAIFCETGLFDLIAVRIFHYSRARIWIMISSLCLFSAVLSAFLDNVTTILLLTPITIRLCEVMSLDPKLVIIAEVIFSNIGGTSTAIGDPPNVIITANAQINAKGIDFTNFTLHMFVGSILVYAVSFLHFRLQYASPSNFVKKTESELDELKKEIKIWRRTFQSISPVTKEEKIVKTLLKEKISQLSYLLSQRAIESKSGDERNMRSKSQGMVEAYKITNKPLLMKCGAIFSLALILFFLNPFVTVIHLTIGYISIMAALVLLAISSNSAPASTGHPAPINEAPPQLTSSMSMEDEHGGQAKKLPQSAAIDFEALMHKIEWSTLLFFGFLFIFMKCIEELGLLKYLGALISDLIKTVSNKSDRLVFALLVLLILSALISSIIDNIPMTTAMIPIILQLSEQADLPIQPLVYALAFGSCLGGNGTLIGASCNLVAAGIAEQHGYKITFKQFFSISFPIMITSILMALVYVCVTCVYFNWY